MFDELLDLLEWLGSDDSVAVDEEGGCSVYVGFVSVVAIFLDFLGEFVCVEAGAEGCGVKA